MSQIQIGNRVAINSFKFKGQEGVVKFFGEVEDKIGSWVGVELDLPKGDMDGTLNGSFLFECKPGHGLLLRSTQVKILAVEQHQQQQVPPLNLGIKNNISDSPLLTPKDPPPIKQMTLGTGTSNPSKFLSKPSDSSQQDPSANDQTAADSKTSSWKDRLEKLRKQKELKKLQEEELKSDPKQQEEEEKAAEQKELKKMFAPTSGITRTKEGQLAVKQEEVVKPQPSKQLTSRQQVAAEDQDNEKEEQQTIEEKKKPVQTTAKIGLKGPPASRIGGPKTSTTTASAGNTGAAGKQQISAADSAKEKLVKKNEELRAKLESRQSEAGTKTAATTARTTLNRAAAQKEEKKASDIAKPEPTKPGLKKLGDRAGNASVTRPLTARQSVKPDDNKAEETAPAQKLVAKRPGLKPAEPASKPGLKPKTGPNLGKQPSEDQSSLKASIIEEDEDSQTTQPQQTIQKPQMTKSPMKSLHLKQQSIDVSDSSMTFGSSVSQAEFKKQEADLRKKKEEVFALQIEVKELSEKISELQKEQADKIEEVKTEYEIKILELETKLSEQASSVQQLNDAANADQDQVKIQLEDKIKKEKADYEQKIAKLKEESELTITQLRKEKEEALKKVEEKQKELENAKAEIQKLTIEVEAKQLDLETIQLEIDVLKDEKEELLTQLQSSTSAPDASELASLSEDELRSQNQKLRQALQALTLNFEVERSKFSTKMHDMEEKVKLVQYYEKKLEDMDLLIEELDMKDQELKTMEEKVDEANEFEKMVEEMAEEILKKEEENEALMGRIQELEEMNGVQEELNENQDQYVKELTEDLANKEAEVFNMEQNVAQLEEMVLEQDQKISKYKLKVSELNQKSKMLQSELQMAYAQGDQKIKISTLIEKQNQLITRLREAGKKEMDTMIQKIEFWQEKLKSKVIEGFIPKRLTEETRLDSLEKIQMLIKTKNKALLLTREICEKQVNQSEELHEEPLQQMLFVRLLIGISETAIRFIDASSKILYFVQKMPIEKYQELTKLMAWHKFELANQFIDKVLELLKEESLSPKFDYSTFTQTVKAISDLQQVTEAKYIEKNPEEINEEMKDSAHIAQQERHKEVAHVAKLILRNECLKMSLGVMSLPALSQIKGEETIIKCKLIYWRILDIIFKLDSIDSHDVGLDFLNLHDLGTDKRFDQKFTILKALWERDINQEPEPQERDWSSILEAIERDITQLINDYKFKKLENILQDEYKNQQIQIDDIYSKNWNNRGPWTLIVDKIRQDLEDTGAMKDKIESLQEKVKDQAMQYLMIKREREDLQVVNQSLEKRLGDAQSKAEKVPALEMEKKRLQDKETYFNQQLDMAKKEIESLREKEKELQTKVTDMETNPMFGSGRMSLKKQGTQVTSTTNAQARQSRTSQYFQKLVQSSWYGNKKDSVTPMHRQTTSVTSNELQKQLQFTEEAFTNVILELQKDRMMLKGQNMLERLHKLEKADCPMNEFIKQQREKREVVQRLTRDEQNKLESALDNVMYLKKKMKKEMALIKVIDITKREEQQKELEKQLKKDILPEGKEKLNYEILKAKDQVNEAFKTLFGKDSKLHQVKSLAQRDLSQLVPEQPSKKLEQLKVGSIKVSGPLQLKSVISLVPNDLEELKQLLSIFSN